MHVNTYIYTIYTCIHTHSCMSVCITYTYRPLQNTTAHEVLGDNLKYFFTFASHIFPVTSLIS